MLAGLMKAPSRLCAEPQSAAAADRARDVINAMAEQGFITEPMAQLALAQPAPARSSQRAARSITPPIM